MEKTIQLMKESGLFDSLVDNILKKDMPKDAVAVALDAVCSRDGNFEDTFFNDMHELAMCIIWKELCWGAEVRREEDLVKKQESERETIEDLLKKIIDLLSE